MSTPSLVLPSQDDPVVAGAVEAIGGPPGRRARVGERRFWTPVRVIVAVTLLTSLLGLWQKSPCRVHPWADEYQYTRLCYTDVFALYYAERLNEEKDPVTGAVTRAGATPYYDHPVEYPPVIGAVMGTVAKVVNTLPEGQRPRRFYDLTWVLLTGCAVVVAVTTARLAGRRRVWDAALFAAAPGLLLHATTNWDLVAGAIAGLGLVQWQRRRPLAAGVLLGVATATKLYPVLLLVPLLLLCLRAGRLREWGAAAGALAVTAGAICLPVYLTSPYFVDEGGRQLRVAASPLERLPDEGLSALAPKVDSPYRYADGRPKPAVNSAYRFVELNNTRGADWDSVHYAIRLCEQRTKGAVDRVGSGVGAVLDPLRNAFAEVADASCGGLASIVFDDVPKEGGPDSSLNRTVAISFLLSLVLIAFLVLRAPRRPRLMQVSFLVMVAFLLTNKVFSPQYVLWLLPFAVLARPRWRPFLAWQATEVMVLVTRFYFFVHNDGLARGKDEGIDAEVFVTAVLVRDLALLVLCAFVVRDMWRPDRDVVRRDGVDDPAGGVLDGAPDRRDLAERRPAAPADT